MAIWRRFAGWISNATRAQAHGSARAPKPTPTQTHSRAGMRGAHARTHTNM